MSFYDNVLAVSHLKKSNLTLAIISPHKQIINYIKPITGISRCLPRLFNFNKLSDN